MTTFIGQARNPRLGEAVFIWTGQRLEAGRIVGIYAAQPFNLERFHIYLIDQNRLLAGARGDFALLPELRHLIPRMGRSPVKISRRPSDSIPPASGRRYGNCPD